MHQQHASVFKLKVHLKHSFLFPITLNLTLNLILNRTLLVKVDVPTKAVLNLIWMGPGETQPMGLVVYRSSPGEKKRQRISVSDIMNANENFSDNSSAVLSLTSLTPDFEYTIVPSTLEPRIYGQFVLVIHASTPISFVTDGVEVGKPSQQPKPWREEDPNPYHNPNPNPNPDPNPNPNWRIRSFLMMSCLLSSLIQ